MYELGRQISQRFQMWKEELKNHLYTPAGTVSFRYCVTLDHPSPEEAGKMSLLPCPVGTEWGGMWEYGWFFADVTLPETISYVWLQQLFFRALLASEGELNEQIMFGSIKVSYGRSLPVCRK